MSFAHLHCHTEYSLLDGSNKIKDYVKRLKECRQTAAAITDHGVMYGVIDFYNECKANNINPVLGCEVYLAKESRFQKMQSSAKDESRYYHLVLLAENNIGYSNLTKIVSLGFTEGYYYKPRIDMEILREYHEGLICLSACLAGEIPRAVINGNFDEAKAAALRYIDCFGKNNFFLELQDHGIPDQKRVNKHLIQLAKELNIGLVATNDCHYTYAEDAEAHDHLLCIKTGKKVSDTNRMRYTGGQYYVKSEAEMLELFPYAEEAIENTQKIADRCHVDIEFGKTKLPHFDVPEGHTSSSWLRHLSEKGLKERYPDDDGTARARMEYELSVIEQMGYVDYFLIVSDYVLWAISKGISVGPGRGSGVGSIVTYCIYITNVDPLKYGLLFERLLNPERVSMPDIDIDFEDNRRQEVIDYVTQKYGKDHVVQIITFGTLAARGVVRDVARVMDLPYSFADNIAKMIPAAPKVTLDSALAASKELKALYDSDKKVHKLIDMGKKLEGLPRHSSTHAAGVIICASPADELVPLAKGSDESIVTQFPAPTLESLGLLKMDFLGLRTLSVIKDAAEFAGRRKNTDASDTTSIDMESIDLNDPQTLSMISSGHTSGVFQLESSGMQSFMKDLKPDCFEDIVAGIALYRPGPMQFIPTYIKGKNDKSGIKYLSPELEPILKSTYGCIIYQEQVMQIVQQLGGYSMGRADEVRRAMSKKKFSIMEKERSNFIYGNEKENVPGCISRGIGEKTAAEIYDSLISFANYGFNKSHSVSYAVLSMQTAWLKTHYPVEFEAALFTSVIDFPPKLAVYMADAAAMGIKILPPDINEGGVGFTPLITTDIKSDRPYIGGIRYALTAIKGIGFNVVKDIVEERKRGGKYQSLSDFLERLFLYHKESCNKRVIENLIHAGALDCLGGHRKQYIHSYARILEQIQDNNSGIAGQMSLFDFTSASSKEKYLSGLPDIGEFDKEIILENEKEVLGIYISGHPLENDSDLIKKHSTISSSDLMTDDIEKTLEIADGSRQTIGGIISSVKTKLTKNNKTMAFLEIEDLYGSCEVIVFPKVFEQYSNLIRQDLKVFISGRINIEEEKSAKILAEKIASFSSIPKTVWIRCTDKKSWDEKESKFFTIISDFKGGDRITVYLENTKQIRSFGKEHGINANSDAMEALFELFGKDNCKLQ